ncbi:MAG: bifunctional 4-hydroxy-2-oxoglutarate aldolase/2-dehydro-3-deoxy-phosphogluconate aldolase [Segetibacter sp.]|nr:bifunctional 4-hydroxy-2-oxoglutarate aldolase/2-dehydro-3-deoxy-phosphogluconate aldolase [Segetibacter sp.]
MDKKAQILKLVPEQGVLPLFFHKDAEVSVEVMRALYKGGIRALEYTNRGEAAFVNFKRMKEVRDSEMPDMMLGIGTIKNGQQAREFIEAGADYIISPGFVKDAADEAAKAGLLYVPGCMTPTEIIAAEQYGIQFIKLFPGNILGPDFMAAIKELFPNLIFMPTGGVDLDKENIAGWFKAGVKAVGMGSKLISKTLLEEKNYSKIAELTKEVVGIINSIKNK